MPLTFNLLKNAWLPIVRTDGSADRIAPWQIVSEYSNNPVAGIAWPRADFNGATLEFLIGLLATAFAPRDVDQWLERWQRPPTPEQLQAAFERHAFAFDLDGDGPRFLQELGDFDDPSVREIASLLIEQPGEQSLERHADHFVKHGGIRSVSRAAAAIALYAAQAYSPAGGRGFLTSMRGGGPLTTLVAADRRDQPPTLWDRLWPNVPETADWNSTAPSQVFPWLTPPRLSKKHPVTTPEHGHPLQAFWGMPRRIRLVFEPANGRRCDLGGPADDVVAVGWQTKQYGVKYEGWTHPLSPYVKPATNELASSVKAKPGGVSYRHWLGLIQDDTEQGRHPARCVGFFRKERAEDADLEGFRVLAFGFDMDNMKARGWYQSEMPVPAVPRDRREAFDAGVAQLVRAADRAASLVRSAVKQGLFARPADAKGDFSGLTDRFWRDTETRFFAALDALASPACDDQRVRESWLADLRAAALAVFDDAVASGEVAAGSWQRRIKARKSLVLNFDGKVRDALELGTPVRRPKTGRKAKEETQ